MLILGVVLFRTACWILFVSAAGYIISAVILVATPNNDPDAFFNIRLFPLMNVFSMFFLAVFFIPVSIIMTRIFNMVRKQAVLSVSFIEYAAFDHFCRRWNRPREEEIWVV